MTTDGGGDGGSGDGDNGGDGGADGGDGGSQNGDSGGSADDLSTIFTPEMVEARKQEIASQKAEEERRAGLTQEQRDEEDRLKSEEAEKNAVPEEYADFTAPEGITLDKELIDEFKPLAKEAKLTQAGAQKFVELAGKMQQRLMDGVFAAHEERKAAWIKEAEADPEIGADVKLGKDSATLRAFNTITAQEPKFKAMVDELGIGNHPEFLRVFYRISKGMREDTFEIPGGGGDGSKSTADILYGGKK